MVLSGQRALVANEGARRACALTVASSSSRCRGVWFDSRRPEETDEPQAAEVHKPGEKAVATTDEKPTAEQPIATQPAKKPASKRFKAALKTQSGAESTGTSANAYLAMVQQYQKGDENRDGTDGKWLVR